jgi:hypothetical protein
MDIQITMKINKIIAEGDIDLTFEYEIDLEYNEFLSFYIPTIETTMIFDNTTMVFKLNFFSININFEKFPENPWKIFENEEPQQSSESVPISSDNTNDTAITVFEAISSIGDAMGFVGLIYFIAACVKNGFKNPIGGIFATLLSLIIGGIEFALWISLICDDIDNQKRLAAAIFGFGVGVMISGFAAAVAWVSLCFMGIPFFKKIPASEYTLLRAIGFIDDICAGFGIVLNGEEKIKTIPKNNVFWWLQNCVISLIGGFFGLTLGVNLLMTVEHSFSKALGAGLIFIGFFIAIYGLAMANM